MAPLKPALLASLLVCTSLITNPTKADGWFFFDPVELEAEIRFDAYLNNTTTASSNIANKRTTLLLEERLFVGLSGYVVDPRISNFLVKVAPVFRQGRESIDDTSDSASGNDLDYNIRLGLLQDSFSPVEATLSTFRTTSANDIAFGSRNNSDVSAHFLSINWKNPWLPLVFSYTANSLLQEFTRLDGLTSRREEDRDKIQLLGRNGKLKITLDNERVDEKVFDRDYTLNRALMNHNFRWGHNSYLRSNVRFFDRQGFNTYQQFSWDERVLINHTDSLSSSTSYRYFSQQSLTDFTSQEGVFDLNHSLYNNLDSLFRMRARSEKSDSLNRQEYEVEANANYHKAFDFGVISAGLYGDYGLTDRVSEAGTAETINEEHVAGFVERIILEKPLIDELTIVVTAEDNFVYTAGIDYEVIPFGGIYTEIRIRPSGRITAGDVLLVSYLYELLPSAEFNSLSTGYSFSYDYRWIRLYHDAYRSDYSLISGFGQPPDQKNRSTGFELSWDFPNTIARFRAETRFRQHGGFESSDIAMNQTLGFSLSNTLNINLSGNQVFSESNGVVTLDPLRDPDLQLTESSTDFYTFDASLTWFARPNLTVSPSLGVWRSQEKSRSATNRDVDRQYYNAELRVSWLVRKLTMDFYYSHNANDINETNRVGDRLFFSVRRVFR